MRKMYLCEEIERERCPQIYTKREWDEMSFMLYYKNVEHDKIVLQ